ncbi:recombinase family protein [Thiocapsa imhoffii]|uniref:recombinase family protein n=1 Tax=Thiocapsa imhoffii TaxID=382777 RepID=UPI003FCC56CB
MADHGGLARTGVSSSPGKHDVPSTDSDTLVLWKLDRLGRDLRHLVNRVHDLTARGVGAAGNRCPACCVTLCRSIRQLRPSWFHQIRDPTRDPRSVGNRELDL